MASIMTKHRLLLLLVLLAALLPSFARKRKSFSGTERSVRIMNQSEVKIDVFWIHITTRELDASQTEGKGIAFGSDTGISSYTGHSFEIQELPNEKTKKCRQRNCRKAYFSVSANEDQWYTVTSDFFVKAEDHKTRALTKAKESLKGCTPDRSLPAAEQFETLTACLERQVNSTLEETQEEINFQSKTRQDMGELLVNYACHDTSLNTTVTVHNRTWTYSPTKAGTKTKRARRSVHRMKTLFDSDRSSVQLVENFITQEECNAIQEAAVASDDNADKLLLPASAKVSSAGVQSVLDKIQHLIRSSLDIEVDYSSRSDKDPLLEVYTQQRSVDSEQQCTTESAESGSCAANDKHEAGEMIVTEIEDDVAATLMIFCGTSKAKGGAIHFPRTGVHVNPAEAEGEALLMIYMDSTTGERDQNAFISEYVACPIKEGSSQIVVDSFTNDV